MMAKAHEVVEHDPTDTRTCPSPGGCASCPDPSYCQGLRVGTRITTTEQEYAARELYEQSKQKHLAIGERDREADAAVRFRDEALRFMRERDDALAEVERLRKENARLREALREAISWTYDAEDLTPERRYELEGLL